MEVVSTCALRPAWVLWQTSSGALTLTLVAKATYQLCPLESPLAPDQDPPNEWDDHWNDDERRSLRAAGDLVPFKVRADVMVVGRAFAPHAQPVRSLVARVAVAEIDKSIEVFADRAVAPDGSIVEGPPFVTMPLAWERAAGGPGTDNPVGVRPDGPRDLRGMSALPNLQPRALRVTGGDVTIAPVGFGPLAPSWPARRKRLRGIGSAQAWDHRRWHLGPLPNGLDPKFFNAAPFDQQIAVIRADERILLENLHPDHPRLVTNLAGGVPSALVQHAGGATEEIRMRCDTLLIDTERAVCSLTWRGQVPIEGALDVERVVINITARGARARTETAAVALGQTQDLRGSESTPVMPFRSEQVARAAGGEVASSISRGQTMDLPDGSGMPALPFRVGRSPLAGTVLGARPPAPPAPVRMPAPPMVPAPALPVILAPAPADSTATEEDIGETTVTEAPQDLPGSEPAAPPAAPDTEELPLEAYPLERCARVAASIAHRKSDKDRILAEHELTPDLWERLHRHWTEHVRAHQGRGKMRPLEAYDAAYVAQLEEERGPILPEEQARLLVAMERGGVEDTLAALDLPEASLLRVHRVMLRRLVADAALERAVRRAVEAAREE